MTSIERVEELIKRHKELSHEFDKLQAVMGNVWDAPFAHVTWTFIESYIATVAEMIGDNVGWLSWFIYDNECGKKGLEARFDRKLRPVRTVKQLMKIIEEGTEIP